MARLSTDGDGDILELVVGAFGEVSANMDRVVSALAESRVLFSSRESGKPVTDGWWNVILGQHRPFFSVLFVKIRAACLCYAVCSKIDSKSKWACMQS